MRDRAGTRRGWKRGSTVFVRGVALWLLVLGLSYVFVGLALVDAYHHGSRDTGIPFLLLPWGLSERELLAGSSVMGVSALAASTLLWCLTRLGRILSTAFLVGVAGWAVGAICTTEFAVGPVAFAVFNLWLASILWRSDVAAVLRARAIGPSV